MTGEALLGPLVLSLWQPWATLMVTKDPAHGGRPSKGIETRGWRIQQPLPIRIAIHATKGWNRASAAALDRLPFARALERCGYYPHDPRPFHRASRAFSPPRGLIPIPLGAIVGLATVTACVSTDELFRAGLGDDEAEFGDYGPGRFGFLTDDCLALKEPVPFTGQQSVLYPLDMATASKIRAQFPEMTWTGLFLPAPTPHE